MNEELFVERDADMQFLVREMHEDQIARLKLAPRNRHSAGSCSWAVRGTRMPAPAAA